MTAPPAPAAAPPWTVITCVTAACSRCGAAAGDEDEGYTPHFTSTRQARGELTGHYEWRITAGGQLLCKACAADEDCARLGHQPWTLARTLMADGRVTGESAWCDRCGHLLSHEPATPAPAGYPAPLPARQDLYWDAAALPGGQDLAAAAARLLVRLSDTAVAARWDAWPGGQAGRPAPAASPDPAADKAAARALIRAARQLLRAAADAPAAAGREGAR